MRFLCTGNMVRSAFAELYARHLGCPLPLDSAATVYRNEGLHPVTRAALVARGVERALLDAFRPRHLERLDFGDPGRLVFGMAEEHLAAYRAAAGSTERLFLATALLGRDDPVGDPVLEGASFDGAFATLERCVEVLVGSLATG